MKFHDYEDFMSLAGHRPKGVDFDDVKRFYAKLFDRIENDPPPPNAGKDDLSIVRNMAHAEPQWYFAGRPYYKVWPSLVEDLIRTGLDVPCESLRVPYSAFVISLPEIPLVSFRDRAGISYLQNIFVSTGYLDGDGGISWSRDGSVGLFVGIIIDAGVRDISGQPMRAVTLNRLMYGDTLEVSFAHMENGVRKAERAVPASVLSAATRLAVAVSFIATGSEKMLERDIIKKHELAYHAAPEGDPRRKRWEEKTERLWGKKGWHMGRRRATRRRDLSLGGKTYAEACQEAGGGRALLYQHQRCGHFHTYRTGKGRTGTKVVWIDETTVKAECPPKPIEMR